MLEGSDQTNPNVRLLFANDRTPPMKRRSDPGFPYELEMRFEHARFMEVAAASIMGPYMIYVLGGRSLEALRAFLEPNKKYARLKSYTIKDPSGEVIEEYKR